MSQFHCDKQYLNLYINPLATYIQNSSNLYLMHPATCIEYRLTIFKCRQQLQGRKKK